MTNDEVEVRRSSTRVFSSFSPLITMPIPIRLSLCLALCLALLVCATWQAGAQGCPFCSAVSQTLSQEIAGADVAVIARLLKLPPEADLNSDDQSAWDVDDPNSGSAEFEVLKTVRGAEVGNLAPVQGSTIKVVYFGSSQINKQGQKKLFLISGLAGKQIDWSTPLPLTERGAEYIQAIITLPEKGAQRLSFFLDYLEDEDPLLAQDAYDEFGRAPYEVVTAVGDKIDRPQLIGWIEDSQIGPTRRRLYLTLLGICGKAEDVDFLESLLRYDYQPMKIGLAATLAVITQTGPALGVPVLSEMVKADVRRKQQCLDALIAAYLKLKGPAGLPLIERRFLTNPAAEYTHVYAAVMALRFHGEETDALPRQRLLQSVRLLLGNADIADQVIPDLARWEDWSVLDQLVTMFKDSDADAWVRQPVIAYLLAATEQPAETGKRAEAALAELEALDPQGVKRARSYMAFGLLARAGTKKKATAKKETETTEAADDLLAKNQPSKNEVVKDQIVKDQVAKNIAPEQQAIETAGLTNEKSTITTPLAVAEPTTGPSRVLIIGGPLIAGLFLFGIFALLLRGADVRSNDSQ